VLAGLCRKTLRNTALTLASVMSREPQAAETLTNLLAERIREILPAGEFEVESHAGVLNICGIGCHAGTSVASSPPLLLALPDDIPEKLKKLFMNEGENVQEFLTDVLGEPWPARGAKPHVHVTQDTVQLWWGGPAENEAIVKLRSISREELGL
jgi:hypothetical protein